VVAISVSSVLFGAFSYLGNAPNLMVKAIAEQKGVKMPSFFEYIIKYSIPILLPIVFLNWLLLLLLY
jgi:Na+/H+ antiporter NhaD/arsenite permease-like protein